MGKAKVLKQLNRKHIIPFTLFAISVAATGAYVILQTRAATMVASSEAEQATVVSPAVKISDVNASGGQAVSFNAPPVTPTDTILLNSSFDNLTTASQMSAADFRTALGDPTLSTPSRTSVVSEGGTHGKFIRTTLPAKTSSNTLAQVLGGDAGVVAFPKLQLTETITEASIQYDIRFANNPDGTTFEWGGGGKLPGLGGVATGTSPGQGAGCSNPTNPNVWSARGMWHGPPAFNVTATGKGNEWIGYMYTYRKANGACGEDIKTGKGFDLNKWHTIKQYHKLNTVTGGVPNANGVHKMWLDGVLIKDVNNYLYRNSTAVPITTIYWSMFRGGSEASPAGTWDSAREGRIDIDNLVIKTPGV